MFVAHPDLVGRVLAAGLSVLLLAAAIGALILMGAFLAERRPLPTFGTWLRQLTQGPLVQEHRVYVFIIVLLNALYFYSSFLSTSHWFGFSQLRHLGAVPSAAALVLAVFVVTRARADASRRRPRLVDRLPLPATTRSLLLLSMLAIALGLLFRSTFINVDGQWWNTLYERTNGRAVMLDEMLEMVVHFSAVKLCQQWFGWSLTFTYQVLSVVGGGIFVFALARLSSLLLPERSRWLWVWGVSGGYMQLFFGDVEHYSLVSALMMVYLALGVRFVVGPGSVVAPTIVFALAACFHLLAGFLGVSVLYLWWLSVRRGRRREVLLGIAGGMVVGIGALLATHVYLGGHFSLASLEETLSRLIGSSAGFTAIWLLPRSVSYYLELGLLLFLLFPQVLVIGPLLAYRRVAASEPNVFLACAVVPMSLMMVLWYSALGILSDWNVFAPTVVPLVILTGYNLLAAADLKYQAAIFLGLVTSALVHSYTWIVCNHFPRCY